MKQAFQVVFGLALAAALLAWVLHDKDPEAVAAAVARASIPLLILGGAVNLAHNLFRAWRWGVLLRPTAPDVAFRPMVSAIVIGYLVSWIVPARLGEVVRPALLSAKEGVPLGASLGSVLADRLLDGVALALLFGVGAQFATFHGTAQELAGRIRAGALALTAAVLVVGAVLVAGSAWRAALERRLGAAPAVVRWLGRAFLAVAAGTEALRSPGLLATVLGQSLLAWLTIGLGTWMGVQAAGAEVGFAGILVLLLPLAFGIALPTPGGAGGYHAAMALGLTSLFGVDPDVAVGAGILMHLAIVLPVLGLGPVLLRVERVSWHDLIAAARQIKSLGGATPHVVEASP